MPLHKMVLAVEALQTDDRQNSKITDRHFLFLSDSCTYMVHLGIGPFYPEVAKIVGAYRVT